LTQSPDSAIDQDQVISLLADEWAVIAELLDGLSAEQWSSTVLPGWDVHDVLAHLAGTEYSLAGAALPDVPAEVGPHVHNDIGKVNELWVTALRSRSDAELLADFRELTAGRVASLRAMPSAQFHAASWTPAGPGTYGRFMQIRIFDCWMHEQDIRAAVGHPGNEAGVAAERSLDEVVGALGYIIGKRGKAPDGSSVLISLTGPIERDLHVVTDGRAKVVATLDAPPTATIKLSSSLFLRLAGGREDPAAALAKLELGGDVALARQLATNLAFTI
jgi:uncharacterized protein (TIGR03083 family)